MESGSFPSSCDVGWSLRRTRAGVMEGIVKYHMGPYPEMGSSIFMNPVSNAWMTGTQEVLNGFQITTGN